MAIKNFGFTLDLNAVKTDLVNAVREAVGEAIERSEDCSPLDYFESEELGNFGGKVDEALNDFMSDLDDTDLEVQNIAVAVVGDTISVSVDVNYTENEVEEPDTSDTLTAAVSDALDVGPLVRALNGLYLSVDKKNRILAIVNEG